MLIMGKNPLQLINHVAREFSSRFLTCPPGRSHYLVNASQNVLSSLPWDQILPSSLGALLS